MDSPKKLIVGYDLCEDFTQISCFSYKTMEPIPISIREGEDCGMIPTVLGVKSETKQWMIGEEAIACAAGGTGVIVDHFLDKTLSEDEIEIYGQKFSAITLLEKYIRKTLTLVKNYFPTEQITRLVVTVRETDPTYVDKIYKALSLLGLNRDRAIVMNHAGVYLYYALCQDKSLWMNDVGLFDFSKEGLYFYQIHINRRSRPMIAGLIKKDYSDQLNIAMLKEKGIDPAYIFENTANNALYKQIISTIYFTGNGFMGNWAEAAIKNLCIGRRVFVGQNLYTKGACYAAKALSGDQDLDDFILLNDDMITSYVSVRVYCDTEFKDIPIAKAGENWYEVDGSIEVIPEENAELEVTVNNIMTRDINRILIPINQFPKRPDRLTRLIVNVVCKDKSSGIITITDLGFGELYPESGQTIEHMIEL